MIIKSLVFFVALTAHYWLWGHLSFEKTMTLVLLLVSSVLALLLLGLPVRELIKQRNPLPLLESYWTQGLFYLYVVIIIILSLQHFTGLIQLLLPIKVLLLAAYAYLKFKLRNKSPAAVEANDLKS